MGTGSGASGFGSAGSSAQPVGAFMPPKLGATLGRYQIVATLGHGAMATVFRAHDPQLRRDVAVKVLGMVHAARGGAAERFRREAHAVAALKHRGIVEIYDFVDATETEPSYIVAELIEGPTLRQLVQAAGGRLLPEFAALIALPLLEALSVAHERGVIHRDVKPDNVMVESLGRSARVVLTDFGVAHITGLESMTATGAMVGSPAYMSPEQSRGNDVGPATDLWSLGTMLYEMVTGTVPFAGKDPYTVLAAIIRGAFRAPSQVVATVGADFEAMIMRCLKPRPADRYPSAAALGEELHAFTRAAGLVPEGEALGRYLDAPEKAIADLRPRVADAATERARSYVRRGQLARALAEIGHATAYVPNHAGANRLLRRLSAGRRALRIVAVAAGLAAVLGTVWLLVPRLRSKPWRPARVTAPVPAQPITAVAPPPAPAVVVPPPAAPTAPPPTAPPAVSEPTTAKGKTRSRGARRSKAHTEPPATEATPTPPPVPTAEPPPVAPAAPEIEPPRPGTIALFSKGGFCYPSLDDHPPSYGHLMPVYRDVAAGKHRVFCTRSPGSPKELAGEVDLPSGGRIERTVTEQGGRLTLARPPR